MFSATKESKLLTENTIVNTFQKFVTFESADVIQFKMRKKSQGLELHWGSSFLADKWPVGRRKRIQSWSQLGSRLQLLLPAPWSILRYSMCSATWNLSFSLSATRNESKNHSQFFFFFFFKSFSILSALLPTAGFYNGPDKFCRSSWKRANSFSYFILDTSCIN